MMVVVGVGGTMKKIVNTKDRHRYSSPSKTYFGYLPPNQPANHDPKIFTPPIVASADALNIGSWAADREIIRQDAWSGK